MNTWPEMLPGLKALFIFRLATIFLTAFKQNLIVGIDENALLALNFFMYLIHKNNIR